MASFTPLMPFLRPLGFPRPSTVRHFLRFSTSTQCRALPDTSSKPPQEEDPNLIASRTASPSYPPPSLKSLPRPKISRASHRTAHPTKQREYPTRQPTHDTKTPRRLIPEPITPLPESQSAPNLAYYVSRTASNELPIYLLRKNGGNLKLTRVRKIHGDASVLRDELQGFLGLEKKHCAVNPLTNHVVLKGHFKPQIEKFLRERRF